MRDFKIILYGDFGVGKTSLTTRLFRKDYQEFSPSTIGASFMAWKPELNIDPKKVRFGIWDTAGQERYSTLLPMYLRNANAVFYCWDYTRKFDAETADTMYAKAMNHSPKCHFYLVITKIDLADGGTEKMDAEIWAAAKDIAGVYYTSSLSGEGVQELFIGMAKDLLESPHEIITERSVHIKSVEPQRKCCY